MLVSMRRKLSRVERKKRCSAVSRSSISENTARPADTVAGVPPFSVTVGLVLGCEKDPLWFVLVAVASAAASAEESMWCANRPVLAACLLKGSRSKDGRDGSSATCGISADVASFELAAVNAEFSSRGPPGSSGFIRRLLSTALLQKALLELVVLLSISPGTGGGSGRSSGRRLSPHAEEAEDKHALA